MHMCKIEWARSSEVPTWILANTRAGHEYFSTTFPILFDYRNLSDNENLWAVSNFDPVLYNTLFVCRCHPV